MNWGGKMPSQLVKNTREASENKLPRVGCSFAVDLRCSSRDCRHFFLICRIIVGVIMIWKPLRSISLNDTYIGLAPFKTQLWGTHFNWESRCTHSEECKLHILSNTWSPEPRWSGRMQGLNPELAIGEKVHEKILQNGSKTIWNVRHSHSITQRTCMQRKHHQPSAIITSLQQLCTRETVSLAICTFSRCS